MTHTYTMAQLADKVAALDLSSVLARTQIETGMSDEKLALAEDLYRKFLLLAGKSKLNGQGQMLVPPQLADEIWDRHIADTRKYYTDCFGLYGELLHHDPNHALDDAYAASKAASIALYASEFDVNLPGFLAARGVSTAMAICGGF